MEQRGGDGGRSRPAGRCVVLATHESAYDPVTNGCANVSPAWPRGLGDSALGLLAPGLAALALLALAGGLRRRPQPVWRIAVAGSTAGSFFVVFVVPLPALLMGAEAARAVSPGGVTYYHGDHQGSPVVVSDDAGNEVGRFVYRPFGGAVAIAGGGVPAVGFTNQRRIPAAGLHDYRARIYDPRVGRFLQPDPLVSSRRSPSQALDRYSYVGNDPLNRIDPTGMYEFGGPFPSAEDIYPVGFGSPGLGNLPSPFSDPTAFPIGSTQPSALGIAVLEVQRVTNEVPPMDFDVESQGGFFDRLANAGPQNVGEAGADFSDLQNPANGLSIRADLFTPAIGGGAQIGFTEDGRFVFVGRVGKGAQAGISLVQTSLPSNLDARIANRFVAVGGFAEAGATLRAGPLGSDVNLLSAQGGLAIPAIDPRFPGRSSAAVPFFDVQGPRLSGVTRGGFNIGASAGGQLIFVAPK